MHNKIIILSLLILSVISAYSIDYDVFVRDGTFKDLPEERKLKIEKIKEEFNDQIKSLSLRKNDKRFIGIRFYKESKNNKSSLNKHFKLFYQNVKKVKINDNDSTTIDNAIDVYEKNGLTLLECRRAP